MPENPAERACAGCGGQKPEGRRGPFCGKCDDPIKVRPGWRDARKAANKTASRGAGPLVSYTVRTGDALACDKCGKKNMLLHLMLADHCRGQWWCGDCDPLFCAGCRRADVTLVQRIGRTDMFLCEDCRGDVHGVIDKLSDLSVEPSPAGTIKLSDLSVEPSPAGTIKLSMPSKSSPDVAALQERLRAAEERVERLRRRIAVDRHEIKSLRRINAALTKFVEVTEGRNAAKPGEPK